MSYPHKRQISQLVNATTRPPFAPHHPHLHVRPFSVVLCKRAQLGTVKNVPGQHAGIYIRTGMTLDQSAADRQGPRSQRFSLFRHTTTDHNKRIKKKLLQNSLSPIYAYYKPRKKSTWNMEDHSVLLGFAGLARLSLTSLLAFAIPRRRVSVRLCHLILSCSNSIKLDNLCTTNFANGYKFSALRHSKGRPKISTFTQKHSPPITRKTYASSTRPPRHQSIERGQFHS